MATGTGYLVSTIDAAAYAQASQFAKIPSGGSPERITAAHTYFRRATILAKNSLDGTDNTGVVAIGPSTSNGEQPYVMSAPLTTKTTFTSASTRNA